MADEQDEQLKKSFGHCRDYLVVRTHKVMLLCDALMVDSTDRDKKIELLALLQDMRKHIGWMTGDEAIPARKKVDYV